MNTLHNYFKFWPALLLHLLVLFSACNSNQKTTEEVKPITLEGRWAFVGYQFNNGALDRGDEDAQENPVMEFEQGSYGGTTPKNAYAGSYTLLENNGIVMSPPTSTLAIETQWGVRFLESLSNASHFTLQNNQLRIHLKNVNGWMVFQQKK